jgi:CTD small phosphatase-like protein 2
VDNAVYSFGYQLDNGIPIIPFYEDKRDEEL